MGHVAMIGSNVLGNAGGVLSPDGGGGGGAVQVFDFPNFSGSPSTIHCTPSSALVGSVIQLCGIPSDGHEAATASYTTQQPPTAFTTTFSFTPSGIGSGTGGTAVAAGMTFVIQNTVSPPGAAGFVGLNYAGDANMCGYGGAIFQTPPVDSICIKFDASPLPGGGLPYSQSGAPPCSTGMYLNGGPSIGMSGSSLVLFPVNDLVPAGFNFYSGDTYKVTIVYDGSIIVMVLLDTTTNAQARFEWPLNLANTTNATGNYVGFTAGTSSQGHFNINSWSYYSGYNTRLASPTFSPVAGQYAGTQTVTISGPAGAAIYYTLNGLAPTSSSTLYTGSLTVSANEVIQAVAIELGFTDSLVATGTYLIGTSNTINYPSGFSAGNLIPVGWGYLSGSAYRLTDTTQDSPGALWFPAPINVSSFSTAFTIQFGANGGLGQGLCFVIQNNQQSYSSTPYSHLSSVQITGTGGQISFAATNVSVGQQVIIVGTFGGTGSISGYSSPTAYLISTTNGTTTATLQTESGGALTTTAGTPTGLYYSISQPGWSGGPTALGCNGSARGYSGMDTINGSNGTAFGLLNSVAIMFDLKTVANSVGLYKNGVTPTGNQTATGLTFASGSFNVTLSYSGTTLAMTMQSTGGGTIFSHNFTIDIPGTVGLSTGYVGFTGSGATIQAVTAWTGF
jgi:hypothetical protein